MAISFFPPAPSGYGYAVDPPANRRDGQSDVAGHSPKQNPEQALGPLEQGQAAGGQPGQRPVDPAPESRPGDGQPRDQGRPTGDQYHRHSGPSTSPQYRVVLAESARPEGEPFEAADSSGQATGDSKAGKPGAMGSELPPEQEAEVRDLKQRDREVRNHEQAHVAAGGRYVRGGASYQYQTGPDGRRYAVGGEVSIDTSEASSPTATITKAQTIRRAALAPAQPSAQDRKVAAKAGQMERKARAELAEEKQEQAEMAGEQGKVRAQDQAGSVRVQTRPSQASAPPPISARLRPISIEV